MEQLPPVYTGWRADLWANCYRKGWVGLIAGWLTCPGFRCIRYYRLGRWLRKRGGLGKPLSVLVEQINARHGCYLSSRAEIGDGLRMPHPTGIVIGEGARIGRDVVLYQNVTLGRKNADEDAYPTLADGVTVYADSTLIGGITVGPSAVIGAHSLVMNDIPAGGMCYSDAATIRAPINSA